MCMLPRDAAEVCNSFNGITAGQNQGHPVWGKSWIEGHSSLSHTQIQACAHTHTKLRAALVVLAESGLLLWGHTDSHEFKMHDVKEQGPNIHIMCKLGKIINIIE